MGEGLAGGAFAVTDDFAFDHVDDIFGDVGGMVGDALEVAGDVEEAEEGAEVFGMFADLLFDDAARAGEVAGEGS